MTHSMPSRAASACAPLLCTECDSGCLVADPPDVLTPQHTVAPSLPRAAARRSFTWRAQRDILSIKSVADKLPRACISHW